MNARLKKMKLWEKSIVEWINCLKVLEQPVTSTTELQNEIFYVRFLDLIKWEKHNEEADNDQKNIIIAFLEDQYPSFKVNKNDSTEHIYVASVLLMHLCRKQTAIHHSLQYNMCDKLVDETQLRVKAFLENVLPLGKDVTKETMREVIIEVENLSLSVRKKSPLENFSLPPRSTGPSKKLLTERLRELRDVKCNLALERFTNAELQNDIMKQQDKIKNLQKKLEEKTEQLKILREEWMRPNTPQLSGAKKDTLENNLQYYSKYIEDLEGQLSKQQNEIDKLETEKDTLIKQLSSAQKTSVHYKESFANCERSLESLSDKIEFKDRELVALRFHNEELRAHIKELTKNPVEQSFEGDDVSLSTTMSMNTSEALSTVIEIQLQEAKEESAVLHAQVDSLKEKLNLLTKDHRTALELNRDLQNKLKTFTQVQTELDAARKELKTSSADIAKLREEKESLVAETENLKSSLLHKEEKLSDAEQSNVALKSELDILKVNVKNLNELLANEKTNSANLSTALDQTRSEITGHLAHIYHLGIDRDLYRCSIENCKRTLKDILHHNNIPAQHQIDSNNLDNLTPNDLATYVEKMLYTYDTVCGLFKRDFEKMKITLDKTNTTVSEQQSAITSLEKHNQQNLTKLSALEEDKRQMDLLLCEQKEIIHNYSEEIKALEQVRDEKCVLEQDVCKLKKDLIRAQELLKSFKTRIEDLKKDFKTMREKTHRSVIDYRNASKLTFENLRQSYRTLCENFDEVRRKNEDMEYNFNRNKEELLNGQALVVTLYETLLENNKVIGTFEEKERALSDELNETKQVVENLRETNEALAITKTELDGNLENLKSENRNLSLELKIATDRINLLQEEIDDVATQMESKKENINELFMNVSSLMEEKQHLMRLHEELIDTKNKEIKMKEDALLTLESKVEKLTNEASARENKMKEVIVNLQEVRSSQDAVLAAQEAALKEKCLHIEELQEQFDNSKRLLSKELEDAKLLANEYQVKLSHLENQINNQNKTLMETQEMLKDLSAQLETSNKRCELMDASQEEIAKLCEQLEHPMRNLSSTVLKACSDFDLLCQDSQDASQHAHEDNNAANVLRVIKMTLDEVHKSQKVILDLSRVNAELNETLAEQNLIIENSAKDKEEVYSLKNKIQEMEVIARKRNEYLKNLIKTKESLRDSLQRVFVSQHDLDAALTSLNQKWNEVLTRFENVHIESSVCDEIKQLHAKKTSLENTLFKYQTNHSENMKAMVQILWGKFMWTEQTLLDTYLCTAHERECLDILNREEEDNEFFSQEKMSIDAELEKCRMLQTDVTRSEKEMETFSTLATAYENGLKSGEIKNYAEIEKKLQSQINQLTKERKDLRDKMDTVRARNVKLEKSIDDLRTEMRKVKTTEVATPTESNLSEIKSLRDEIEHLKEQNRHLREEKVELTKTSKQDLENQLKDVYATYERKLDDMKQKMKAVYNEQVMKLNKEQDKAIQERLQSQMEIMCQKHREELDRYKLHISELNSQLWSVGEKLLIEQQKNDVLKRLKEQTQFREIEADQPISTISRKTCKVEKQEMLSENVQQTGKKITTLTTTEETFERRHSIRNIQAMGNAFKTEDEEEVFDNVYLADMKRGNLPVADVDRRLSVLQMRNSLCKPHLKSSYPAEMQFLTSTLTEEEIKGNELRSPSSRILRERNVDRRTTMMTTTTTPHSLKNLFTLKRQDENLSTTPKGRRLSNLFRKPKGAIRSVNE
ncbi:golgin subfamily B member 1-like isoform X2 [Pseudomyrmex gracilis]|uniref:golgin subfamily B member 1-like isoform X2 n=1 Tax=Pseudomyrmex gracilis TaxID=219809 RepID=UPI0009955043|nr:golgin subfamily B member 1-like isoform X2 [Pseudomyrmex gracilis]